MKIDFHAYACKRSAYGRGTKGARISVVAVSAFAIAYMLLFAYFSKVRGPDTSGASAPFGIGLCSGAKKLNYNHIREIILILKGDDRDEKSNITHGKARCKQTQ